MTFLGDLHFAAIAAVFAVTGCGNNPNCSADIDCTSHLSVEFVNQEDWGAGNYIITVEGYDSCAFEMPETSTATSCDNEPEGVYLRPSGFFISGNPESVHVTVEKDGAPFKDIVLSPDYEQPQPECRPSCRVAFENIE